MKELLESKKFKMAAATIISMLLAALAGWEISPDTLGALISGVTAIYLASQGSADHGKSAALVRERVEMARIEVVKATNATAAETKPDPQ